MIKRRIGPGWTDWQPVEVYVMKSVDHHRASGGHLRAGQEDYLREGVFHLIYTSHTTDSDFQLIEADLDEVANDSRRLVLVLEDVLQIDSVRQHFDPSLRDLPVETLFDRATIATKREALAAAYAITVGEMKRTYAVWNAVPAAQKSGVFSQAGPFARRLLAWSADHGVEVVPEETSLDAWLTVMAVATGYRRVDAATVKGECATAWAENRKVRKSVARATRLRDADVNVQITRLLRIERRGHNVLYVVGSAHSINESVLAGDLEAVTHEKRSPAPRGAWIDAALLDGTFDELPTFVRERFETIEFLNERLGRLAPPATSPGDYYELLEQIEQVALSRGFTLRNIVDDIVSIPAFQEAATTVESFNVRVFFAWAFIKHMIADDYISLAEVEKYFPGRPWKIVTKDA